MPAGYVYGPPTDYPDPGEHAPLTMYDDVHGAALLLRTTLFMQKNVIGTGAINLALMQRCWDYLEMMWRPDGDMAYTWSPLPDKSSWSAVAHGEIIETLVACVKQQAYLPAGISVDIVKQRLLLTTFWLKRYGVDRIYNGGDI